MNLSVMSAGVLRRVVGLGVLLGAGMAQGQSAFQQYVVPLTVTVGTVGTAGQSGDGGQASAALLGTPASLAYDAAGNLFLLDKGRPMVRRVDAKTGVITTVAGTGTAGFVGDGAQATTARFNQPNEIALDAAGNIYIADTSNNRVRKVTIATGIVTTIAGDGSTAFAGDGLPADGSGGAVGISGPNAVAVDVQGNVYIGDSGHQRVRKVTAATGIISTVLGNGVGGDTGDGGPAASATINGPRYLSIDARGNVVMTDRTAHVIRQISAAGAVSTLAGTLVAGYTGDGGLATAATLNLPNATAVDALGNVYIMDTGNTAVRVVDAQSGKIYTVEFTLTGTGAGTALSGPLAVAVGPAGQIAIADGTNRVIRQGVLPNAFGATAVGASSAAATFTLTNGNAVDSITTWGLSHSAPADFSFGTVNGCTLGTVFPLNTTCTSSVAFTPTAPGLRVSQLLATDVTGQKSYQALTGVGNAAAVAIGPGVISTLAAVTGPNAVALDSVGNVYVASADNRVRLVNGQTGTVTVVAGTGTAGATGDGAAATAATLSAPAGVVVDPTGNVYVADTGNNVVRVIGAEAGVIRSVTPVGLLSAPKGLATDAQGNVYIADAGNNVVREVFAKTGVIATIAGTGSAGSSGDGAAATAARLSAPAGVAVDASGNVYIADTGNQTVRKVTVATGVISTIAGTVGSAGNTGDGSAATAATLSAPAQIAVDAAGDVYLAAAGSNSVRVVSASTGTITTLVGTGTAGYTGDAGLATAATLSAASGLAIDPFANVFVGDTGNGAVRKVVSTTTSRTFATTDPGKSTAAQNVLVTNFGNQTLTVTGLSMPAGFVQKTSGVTDCSGTSVLAAGGSCVIAVAFSPTGSGPFSGNITLTDNALGKTTSTQTIAVSGTGTAIVPTAITVTSGNNQTTTPYSAFANALTATVVDQNGFGASGVSVTFTAPATGAAGTFANGTNTVTVTTAAGGVATATALTANGTRGAFSVSAKASGITTSASFSETIAGNPLPTVTVAYAPVTKPVTYGASITLTATLVGPPASPNAISGNVTFFDGTTQIGSAVAVSGGKAVSAAFVPGAGVHSYSASYAGDANYSAATSTNASTLTVNALAITATANAISVPFGTLLANVPAITGAALQGVLTQDVGNVTPLFTDPYTGAQGVGTYPFGVTLTGSAAANYTVTTGSGITVTAAPTSLTLTYSPTSVGPTTSVTFTATLTSAVTSGVLAGQSVSFYDGTTLLGTRATGTAGVATFATTLAVGTHTITATFAGATNYATTSTSTSVVVANPDITLSLGLTSITVKQGQVAVVPMTFNTVGGLTTTVVFSCSGLPANSACATTPATFTPSTTASGGTGSVMVTTAGGGITAGLRGGSSTLVYAGLFGVVLLAARKRKKLGAVMLVALVMVSMSGCGGSSAAPLSTVTTPTGSSVITVTATSGSVVKSATFTLVVVPSSYQ